VNQPTKNAIERPWQLVLLLRVAFGLAIVGMICAGIVCFYAALQKNNPLFMVGWLFAAPCALFNVLMMFSLHIFPFDYSWLGRLTPSQPPADWLPIASSSSGVNIANCFHGFASFQFGAGGILVRVLVFSPIFIPSHQIVSVANDSWLYARIDHTSSEIRSPMHLWRSVAREMERCMPELALVRSFGTG